MKSSLVKLHIAIFLWGFTGVLGRLISLNEGLLVWYRILITIISLFLLMKWKGQIQQISFRMMVKLFIAGLVISLHWVCFYGSIKYSNVSIALTCLSSGGLFAAVMEPLVMKKKIRGAEILLGLIAISGIYLIFHFDPRYRTGVIIGLTASILSVTYSIMNKKLVVKDITSKTILLYELTGGWLSLTLLMPFYLYFLPTRHLFPSLPDWGWLLLMSWFCTVLAMDLSLQALKKVSVFTQNLTLNLEPVYGIILAFIVYKENKYLSEWFYYGFALIFLAVILQTLRVVKRKA
jgi:drug/metabolite transporter (DMT)-like permease